MPTNKKCEYCGCPKDSDACPHYVLDKAGRLVVREDMREGCKLSKKLPPIDVEDVGCILAWAERDQDEALQCEDEREEKEAAANLALIERAHPILLNAPGMLDAAREVLRLWDRGRDISNVIQELRMFVEAVDKEREPR